MEQNNKRSIPIIISGVVGSFLGLITIVGSSLDSVGGNHFSNYLGYGVFFLSLASIACAVLRKKKLAIIFLSPVIFLSVGFAILGILSTVIGG